MTNEDRILKGLQEVYKQNQTIIKELEAIKLSVGTVEMGRLPTPEQKSTHDYPPAPTKTKDKPWEKWTKKDDPSEPMTDQDIPEGFKL